MAGKKTKIVLDVVKREIPPLLLPALSQMITRDKSIVEESFGQTPGERKEFALLTAASGLALGKGESACMVYCLYHHDVLGSSNLRDVKQYCEDHGITYLTTVDFLYYAIQRQILTKTEAQAFVSQVISAGSKLPSVDFDTYFCSPPRPVTVYFAGSSSPEPLTLSLSNTYPLDPAS